MPSFCVSARQAPLFNARSIRRDLNKCVSPVWKLPTTTYTMTDDADVTFAAALQSTDDARKAVTYVGTAVPHSVRNTPGFLRAVHSTVKHFPFDRMHDAYRRVGGLGTPTFVLWVRFDMCEQPVYVTRLLQLPHRVTRMRWSPMTRRKS